MLIESLFPASKRDRDGSRSPATSSWLKRQITPTLESISRRACTHPIHTVVFVALLASTTYIGLLEGKLFGQESDGGHISSRSDWSALLRGSKDLCVGEHTAWKWQIDDHGECLQHKPVGSLSVAASQSTLGGIRRP